MVAGWGVGILIACWTWRHLVVALRAGAGLVGALRGGGRIGGKLVCVVPAETRSESGISWGHQKVREGTSLVVQWLRIRLAMQGAWVRSLVKELDPTGDN